MLQIRALRPDEWERYRELRLRALREAPDAFGSTFDREQQRDDAFWIERVRSATTSRWTHPLVAEDEGELVGLVYGKIEPSEPETAHVFQMWVAPERQRLGIGSMLLEAVVRWASDTGARRVVLGVTCGDTPARRLYTRAGFRPLGEPEPLRPGAELSSQPMCLELSPGPPHQTS